MNVIPTEIDGVVILEPKVFGDARGYFFESWNEAELAAAGIHARFIQDNESKSRFGVLRGLHYQAPPYTQAKLVRVICGAVLDVAVDIRKDSPTYKKWYAVELSAENKKQFFMPRGMAHGFVTLTDDVEVQYKVDAVYAPDCDRSIRFDDPEIGVDWGITEPILSEKDLKAPLLAESDADF